MSERISGAAPPREVDRARDEDDIDDLRVAGKAGDHIQEFSGGLAPRGLETTGIGGQTNDVHTAPLRPR